jgi:hypothetical protein
MHEGYIIILYIDDKISYINQPDLLKMNNKLYNLHIKRANN